MLSKQCPRHCSKYLQEFVYTRSVEGSSVKEWLVVPKPLKSIGDQKVKNRCWRLAFHDYEREIIKGCERLKFTIRLVSN